MKQLFSTILFFTLALTGTLNAKQKVGGEVNILSADLHQKANQLYVTMSLDVSKLDVGTRSEVIFTPVLLANDGNERAELPPVLIYGHNRYKVYKRSMALNKNQTDLRTSAYEVVNSKKQKKHTITYAQTLPYEEWMSNSTLVLEGDLCGCGKYEALAEKKVIGLFEFTPEVAYIQPDVEPIKIRTEDTEVFIDFKVNQFVIERDLMNNQTELSKLDKAFEDIKSDKNLTVSRIDIIGYASPEGSVTNNEALSKKRAEELKKYLSSKAYFPSDIYYIQYGGENWNGLERMVEASSMDKKTEVLSILRNTQDVNAKKPKLKALGAPYTYMLANFYPKLRKTITQIHYNVRNFSVEEGKDIFKIRPDQLSLNEMFHIANSYPKGSPEFSNVFSVATEIYPNNRIANLNAGAAALSTGNISVAEKHLNSANNNTPEYNNNMGVYYYHTGDLEKAGEYFSKAAQQGNEVAQKNLNTLKQKTKTEK